jgi:hypothetical protein
VLRWGIGPQALDLDRCEVTPGWLGAGTTGYRVVAVTTYIVLVLSCKAWIPYTLHGEWAVSC